MKFYLLKY